MAPKKEQIIGILEMKFDYYSARALCAGLGEEVSNEEVEAFCGDLLKKERVSRKVAERLYHLIGKEFYFVNEQPSKTLNRTVDAGSFGVSEVGETAPLSGAVVESVTLHEGRSVVSEDIPSVQDRSEAVEVVEEAEAVEHVCVIKISGAPAEEGDRVAVIGDGDILGHWNSDNAYICDYRDDHFECLLPAGEYAFKLAVIKADGEIVREDGENRLMEVNDSEIVLEWQTF